MPRYIHLVAAGRRDTLRNVKSDAGSSTVHASLTLLSPSSLEFDTHLLPHLCFYFSEVNKDIDFDQLQA